MDMDWVLVTNVSFAVSFALCGVWYVRSPVGGLREYVAPAAAGLLFATWLVWLAFEPYAWFARTSLLPPMFAAAWVVLPVATSLSLVRASDADEYDMTGGR